SLPTGHPKASWLDFGLAREQGGQCNLRFDDTDPVKEDTEYVEAIKRDVQWLGFDWGDRCYFASDYFDRLYQWAVQLVERGLAYVDSQSAEQIREGRGNFYKPGV